MTQVLTFMLNENLTKKNYSLQHFNMYIDQTQNRRFLNMNISPIFGREYPKYDVFMKTSVRLLGIFRTFKAVDAN